MNKDFATSLQTFLGRASEQVLDVVAKDGLGVLKKVLVEAGLDESEHLKDYEVFAHVMGGSVMFEILIDAEALEPEDEAAKKDMEKAKILEEILKAARSYGLEQNRAVRISTMRDARHPGKDARRPAGDARRGSLQRTVGHELAMQAPRSLRVNRSGKLSISFRRSVKQLEDGSVRMPQGKFQGIPADFMKRLEKILTDRFAPALKEMVERYV